MRTGSVRPAPSAALVGARRPRELAVPHDVIVDVDGCLCVVGRRSRKGYRIVGTGALKLEAYRWPEYFGSIALDGDRVLATVGLLPQLLSGRDDQRQRPLRAIGYDPGEDVLEVAVGGEAADLPALRYFVSAPQAITVAESNNTRAILVDDASGIQTMIRVLDLRCPHASAQPALVASGFARRARAGGRDGGTA